MKYQSDKYPVKDVDDMSLTEMCRWFAFMNMVKFSTLYARKNNIPTDFDMPWTAQTKYIDEVAGDLEHYVKEKKGVPFKYSLNLAHDDAIITTELDHH